MTRPTRFRANSMAVKIRAMRDLHPEMSSQEIAAELGCKMHNVYQTLSADRLRKKAKAVKVVQEKKTTDVVATPEEEEAFQAMTANAMQVGGNHYKGKAIQPWDYIASNNLGYLEGNIVKYVSRWQSKGGIEDLKKAMHYLTKLIEVNQ